MSKSRSRKFAEFIRYVSFNQDGTPDIQGTANDDELNTQVTTLTAEKEALAASLATLQAEKDALATQLTTVETNINTNVSTQIAALETTVANIDPEPADGSLLAQKLSLSADSDPLGTFDGMTISVKANGAFKLTEPPKLRDEWIFFYGRNVQHTWTVPDRVYSIAVMAIGGGGGDNTYRSSQSGSGGSAGIALRDVVPGDVLTIYVGRGGPGGGDSGNRGGYESWVEHAGTRFVSGRGGAGHGNTGSGDARWAGVGSTRGDYTWNNGSGFFETGAQTNAIAKIKDFAEGSSTIAAQNFGSNNAMNSGNYEWQINNWDGSNDLPGVGGADNGYEGKSGTVLILY